jgi:hypothetical protein
MSISVITTTVRPQGLPIIEKSLKRQTYPQSEWIIVAPEDKHEEIKKLLTIDYVLLSDPPKKRGDFWTLCKAWNKAYAHAKGDLIVNIQDWTWFPPDTLERFWNHYKENPIALISAVGNHYDSQDERGKPVNQMWDDPRMLGEGFRSVNPDQMEMCVCSVPRQAILDCGGVDEIYDTCNGVQEKEMCFRLMALRYEFFIDEEIEYRSIHHGRLSENWDDVYWNVTAPLFKKHANELVKGTRTLNVGCLKKYNKDNASS